ncbi:fas1 domain containing protein [Grosmannia clavigera kw1407]|uniref:Fas1 domain containing protein n=1 Tax=Grosmannia clavigera (strain kw1407 / UAMH 11150) TaxID=655863 RepID=F0XN03_GROCL|nr:fas1 domain containing protein [Grosmannia clavigera kw1407]EFX00891.1 fas1 domain containing protein [Grosmannia clavigera kw1407]
MRLAHLPVFASLILAAVSQLVVLQQPPQGEDRPLPKEGSRPEKKQQQPIVMPVMPPGTGAGSGHEPGRHAAVGTVMLSDVLGRDRSINVFAGFTRDFSVITNRFDDVTQNTTILAPLNSAIEKLPRKPWEDPEDYRTHGAAVYEGGDGQERAKRNLQRFVEAHIVPVSPWPENYKTLAVAGGEEIWWEKGKDGVMVIQPGNIEVASVASTVANGQVITDMYKWIIKGVRNYSS